MCGHVRERVRVPGAWAEAVAMPEGWESTSRRNPWLTLCLPIVV